MYVICMNDKSSSRGKAISGKDRSAVREDILRNVIRLKTRLKSKFDSIAVSSNMDHIRAIARELSESEQSDIDELDRSLREGTFPEVETELKDLEDYETFDHLLEDEPDINMNDLRSILMVSIKYYKDIYDILRIMENEYSDPFLKQAISNVAAKELSYKKKVEDLLEERVHGDSWKCYSSPLHTIKEIYYRTMTSGIHVCNEAERHTYR